jgi:hypothetical protein
MWLWVPDCAGEAPAAIYPTWPARSESEQPVSLVRCGSETRWYEAESYPTNRLVLEKQDNLCTDQESNHNLPNTETSDSHSTATSDAGYG